MERYVKPTGGEFWFEDGILSNQVNNFNFKNAILLNGGQSAIEFILQDINLKDHEYILMPSYLCPTILYKFKSKNINTLFYEINDDLNINIENINKLIKKFDVKALFFINYFGFYHNKETLDYFIKLREKGIILIEDAVQMVWFNKLNKFIGDYIFNSYRKLFPYDGSMVICKYKPDTNFEILKDNCWKSALEARNIKTQYIKNHIGKEEDFLNKFEEAEDWYYKRSTINGMDESSKEFLSHVNCKIVNCKRLKNYNYLYDKLVKNNKVKILFNKEKIEDNIPISFPVIINSRDSVRNELKKYGIYCPVHWNITKEEWSANFPKSLAISKSILSIPIDWRYNEEDMDNFLNVFNDILIR